MGTDLRKTDVKVTSDPRLRAGLRAALECICERHGLPKAEQHELSTAVEKECGEEFHNPRQSICAVTISETEERIEVSVVPSCSVNGSRPSLPETNVASPQGAEGAIHRLSSQSRANGGPGVVFVKHFHKNPAH